MEIIHKNPFKNNNNLYNFYKSPNSNQTNFDSIKSSTSALKSKINYLKNNSKKNKKFFIPSNTLNQTFFGNYSKKTNNINNNIKRKIFHKKMNSEIKFDNFSSILLTTESSQNNIYDYNKKFTKNNNTNFNAFKNNFSPEQNNFFYSNKDENYQNLEIQLIQQKFLFDKLQNVFSDCYQKLIKYKNENEQLKKILKSNGINFEEKLLLNDKENNNNNNNNNYLDNNSSNLNNNNNNIPNENKKININIGHRYNKSVNIGNINKILKQTNNSRDNSLIKKKTRSNSSLSNNLSKTSIVYEQLKKIKDLKKNNNIFFNKDINDINVDDNINKNNNDINNDINNDNNKISENNVNNNNFELDDIIQNKKIYEEKLNNLKNELLNIEKKIYIKK